MLCYPATKGFGPVGPALRKELSSRKVDKCGTVFEKSGFLHAICQKIIGSEQSMIF